MREEVTDWDVDVGDNDEVFCAENSLAMTSSALPGLDLKRNCFRTIFDVWNVWFIIKCWKNVKLSAFRNQL